MECTIRKAWVQPFVHSSFICITFEWFANPRKLISDTISRDVRSLLTSWISPLEIANSVRANRTRLHLARFNYIILPSSTKREFAVRAAHERFPCTLSHRHRATAHPVQPISYRRLIHLLCAHPVIGLFQSSSPVCVSECGHRVQRLHFNFPRTGSCMHTRMCGGVAWRAYFCQSTNEMGYRRSASAVMRSI